MVNKSHAAAYSVVSYYTAWLKHYYPAEYIAALMSHSANEQFDMYINDAKHVDVEVLPPDVNFSDTDFIPERYEGRKAIRFGLASIKGMGVNAKGFVNERVARGPYNSFAELVARCVLSGIQKKALYLLVQSGATMGLDGNYNLHLKNAEDVHEATKKEYAKLLKANPDASYEDVLPALVKFAQEFLIPYKDIQPGERARLMKECLGTYISGNPLEGIKLPTKGITLVQDMVMNKMKVKGAGYIDGITILNRKSDGAAMAKFTFGDATGSIPAICFVNSYAANKAHVIEGNVVTIEGYVQVELDESGEISSMQLIVNSLDKIET